MSKKDVMDAIYEDAAVTRDLPDNESMLKLSELLDEYFSLERRKAEIEQELKNTGNTLLRMIREYIPELMGTLGLDSVQTDKGLKVSVVEVVRARLNKADELKGFAWLKKHGLEGIIKSRIIVAHDKEDPEQVKIIEKMTRALENYGVAYQVEEKVHPQTLQAAIRDEYANQKKLESQGKKLKASEKVPADLFNLFVGREAKIDMKTAKKAGLI